MVWGRSDSNVSDAQLCESEYNSYRKCLESRSEDLFCMGEQLAYIKCTNKYPLEQLEKLPSWGWIMSDRHESETSQDKSKKTIPISHSLSPPSSQVAEDEKIDDSSPPQQRRRFLIDLFVESKRGQSLMRGSSKEDGKNDESNNANKSEDLFADWDKSSFYFPFSWKEKDDSESSWNWRPKKSICPWSRKENKDNTTTTTADYFEEKKGENDEIDTRVYKALKMLDKEERENEVDCSNNNQGTRPILLLSKDKLQPSQPQPLAAIWMVHMQDACNAMSQGTNHEDRLSHFANAYEKVKKYDPNTKKNKSLNTNVGMLRAFEYCQALENLQKQLPEFNRPGAAAATAAAADTPRKKG